MRVPVKLAVVGGVLMYRMGCYIVGKRSKRQPSLPTFLSIVVEDAEGLFECLDSSLTESISL